MFFFDEKTGLADCSFHLSLVEKYEIKQNGMVLLQLPRDVYN